MTIEDFIADKIRKRFDLPAGTRVIWWVEGINLHGDIEIFVTAMSKGACFNREIARYEDWDEFVADMERGGND